MSRPIYIGPSILSADFARLGEQIQEAEAAGAGYIHFDVMDGQFVPPVTFGSVVLKSIRRYTTLPIDVHFMVVAPERYLAEYADAGADYLTVHVEATTHLHRTLSLARELGKKAGAALNPGTPLNVLTEVLHQLDLINVLAVNPGYSGQAFIPQSLAKISRLRRMLDGGQHAAILEVDGGVAPATVKGVVDAGAEWVVAGSAVYNDRDTVANNIAAIRQAAGE